MLGKGLESLIPPSGPQEPEEEKLLGTEAPWVELPGAVPATAPAAPATAPVSVPPPTIISAAPAASPVRIPPVSEPVHTARPADSPRFAGGAGFSAAQASVATPPVHHAPRENFAERGPAPAEALAGRQAIFQIEVEKIAPNPHQPRKEFNDESLRELAQSIREFGILQPLIVTKIEHETPTGVAVSYELIAGERRLMASKILGLPRVPAIIRTVDTERNRLEMAVIENIQRENLNPVEMARAFARLQDEFRMTQREIASRLGKSREVVANTLRLLDAPSYIQDSVSRGEISESHARLLLSVGDPDAQERLFRDLLDRHLTTRELRLRIGGRKPASSDQRPATSDQPAAVLSPELLAVEEKLTSELGTPVKIAPSENGGKITIMFYSPEELQSILHKLGTKEEA